MFSNPFGRATGAPPVAARPNTVGPEHHKLWSDIEAAMLQTLQVIRSDGKASSSTTTTTQQQQQPTTAATLLNQMGWHAKVYKAVTTTGVAAEFIYLKFRAFVEHDLKVNVCNALMRMFKESSTSENNNSKSSGGDNTLFAATAKYYQQFCVFRRFARIVLQYIDQFYTARHHKMSIVSVMNALFYNIVYVRVKDVLAAVAFRRVNAHRCGDYVDMNALRGAIRLFAEISITVSPTEVSAAAASSSIVAIPSSTTASAATTNSSNKPTDRFRLDFLDKYVDETTSFYRGAASRQMQLPTGPQTYVAWFEERMLLEEKLVQDLLPVASWHEMERALHRALVDPFVEKIIQHPTAGVQALIREGSSDALKHLYHMAACYAVAGPKAVAAEFQQSAAQSIASVFADYDAALLSAKEETQQVASAKPKPVASSASGPEPTKAMEVALVVSLVGVWEQYRVMIATYLASDAQVQHGLATAFQNAFNPDSRRPRVGEQQPAEKSNAASSLSSIFSSYVDMLCRRELNETFDSDSETQRVEALVVLVMFLQDRDVFQESFRSRLAKRLLQTTPTLDLEHLVLEKLQRSLGKTYTFRMEAMLRDHEHTGDLQRAFEQHRAAQQRDGGSSEGAPETEMAVQVLTASHWPAYRCDEMTAPRSLEAGMRSFRFFYTKKHASRTLSWVHALGSSQLQVQFPKGTKDITCSIFQASILLAVAEAPKQQCSVAALAATLSLSLNLVKMQVASMYLHKVYNLLTLCDADGAPCPPAKAIHDGDMLTLNTTFAHKLRKFKLAAPVATRRDGEPTKPEMESLRRAQTDAAIVRVMKSRRRLAFNDLHEQAIHQLSKLFLPPAHFFKQRLEDLIARGYVRRDENDRSVVEYVA